MRERKARTRPRRDGHDPYFPFNDSFGQYRHRDWPGKVRSLDELCTRRNDEAKELTAQPGPAGWGKFDPLDPNSVQSAAFTFKI